MTRYIAWQQPAEPYFWPSSADLPSLSPMPRTQCPRSYSCWMHPAP